MTKKNLQNLKKIFLCLEKNDSIPETFDWKNKHIILNFSSDYITSINELLNIVSFLRNSNEVSVYKKSKNVQINIERNLLYKNINYNKENYKKSVYNQTINH